MALKLECTFEILPFGPDKMITSGQIWPAGLEIDMCVLYVIVQVHLKGKEDQPHRLHAEDAGAVLLQPGGSDQREDGGAGGGETENRPAGGPDVAQVSIQQLLLKEVMKLWSYALNQSCCFLL